MIATNIEQSKRLLEAGFNVHTSDAHWFGLDPESRKLYAGPAFWFEGETIVTPAWSLSALIMLLPERVFYRLARARGHDVEGLFEDCVNYLTEKNHEAHD